MYKYKVFFGGFYAVILADSPRLACAIAKKHYGLEPVSVMFVRR